MRHTRHQGVTYRTPTDFGLMPSKALGTSWPNGLLLSRLRTDETCLCGLNFNHLLLKTYNALRYASAVTTTGHESQEVERRKKRKTRGGEREEKKEEGGREEGGREEEEERKERRWERR